MAGDPESVASSSNKHIVSSLDEIETRLEWYRFRPNGLDQISARVGHALVPLKDGKVILIGGGNHEGALGEIWNIDLRSGSRPSLEEEKGELIAVSKQETPEGFKGRYEFLCVKGPEEDEDRVPKIWIFGGANSASSMDDVIYLEDGVVIESVTNSGKAPSARTQGGNTVRIELKGDTNKSYLGVFAGGLKGEKAVPDGNLYLYDIEEQTWTTVPTKSDTPPNTQGHAMTAFGSKIFVHGGIHDMTLFEGLYMIDIEEATQSLSKPVSWVLIENLLKKPPGRAAHGMTRSPEDCPSSFYIFGGLGEQGGLNDLWRFDTDSKSWTELINPNEKDVGFHPCPRFDFAITSIRLDDKKSGDLKDFLLVHGGMNSQGDLYDDLWAIQI